MTTTCPTGSTMTATATSAAADHPLHARRQRHALRDAAGLQLRRPVLRLSEGQLRHALRRGQGRTAAHDEHRPALPAGRPAGPRRGAEALHRLRAGPREGLAAAPHRHRPPLAGAPSLPRAGTAPLAHGPRDDFVRRFGGVFEHSPWIAERAYRRWNSAPRTTRPAGCTTRWRASSARPARPSASACSTPIPTSPASWRRPSA